MKNSGIINKISELYRNGENIIDYLKKIDGRTQNDLEDILISYDFQAGSYIEQVEMNPDFKQAFTGELAGIINKLGPVQSIMEAGVGEATTLVNLINKIEGNELKAFGFDISWSRIKYARHYAEKHQKRADLFVGDLFQIPIPENSIDIVYTSHSIEPNGGREAEALSELYRVARKFLILLEPTDEFTNEAGRERMSRLGYIRNIKKTIQDMGLNLIEYKPFPFTANPLNPTGLYIIQKNQQAGNSNEMQYACPISGGVLQEFNDHYFCETSLLSYPKIDGIPCLLGQYAILTSKHDRGT